MLAEFVRDDCNNVWFTYANKIVYRRVVKKDDDIQVDEEALREAEKIQDA
eukprot:CAMPEP_0185599730 /NCGR_PEP_ID=MMETSP0434-20130131/82901_1 /TAXON_ID=626734 ORGANISM="Favella taraikaensis, Strain Fe Narragansett Bay" /NCGR_SAMPLE_ID=MMETSP0434 /ASSEMBLY_ACC=CAM_ASM_000379 /LENGTH=49 /DNA_ID=CAMNT_0028229231 /DNA_START=628 /DNA_END=777 /DNA_ORIENTATION=-